jgi:glycosidase
MSARRSSIALSAVLAFACACQSESADDPRAGFTGDAAPPAGGQSGTGGQNGMGGMVPGGGSGGQGSGGALGGTPVPADACRYTFVYRQSNAPGAPVVTGVRTAGSFEPTPWAGEVRLEDPDADGFFTADLSLVPGRYEYKFVVQAGADAPEQWVLDPDNPQVQDDGRGNTNSILEHTCPFLPECLADADCEARAPGKVCRFHDCVDASTACECEAGFHCDAAGACVPDPQCDAANPCADPLVCREGVCGPECTGDAECDAGDLCRDFTCVTPECMVDADCDDPLQQTCADLTCGDNPCALHLFTWDPGAEAPQTVHVAGSFNDWAPTIAAGGWAMTWDAERLVWWTKHELPNGNHQYKFVINEGERWIADPANPEQIDDTVGGFNSVLTQDCQGAGPGACGDVAAFDWRDAVMYFILVDRFFDSDGRVDPVPGVSDGDAATGPSGQYEGGDLAGVAAKVPYLRDLGVTALWLSAPYENRNVAGAAIDPGSDPHTYSGYHGYWPSPGNIDFTDPDNPRPAPAVESRIGTADDLHSVVDSAHESGIKVLFDYVMGHADSESGLVANHMDWFVRDNGRIRLCGPENLWDDPVWGVLCAFTEYLPKFDFRRADVRAWSVSDALWWAKTFGIDGYRLDAIKHQPLDWLRDLRARLNAEIAAPDGGRFYLVGETFAYDDQALIRRFVDPATLLDGQFDFPFKARLCEALFTGGGRLDTFSGWIAGNDAFYGPGSIMTTWIGNHDIPRAIHFASGEIGSCREGSHPGNGWTNNYRQPGDAAAYERLGLAFTVMFTNPGIPLIYYGDEVGLAGGGDPDNRRMMPWNDAQLSAPQRALRNRVTQLGRIRAENKVLARGRRIPLSADQDTWVYRMTGCGGDSPDVTVAINRSGAARTVNIPAADGGYTDLLNPGGAAIPGGSVEVPPRGALILRSPSPR